MRVLLERELGFNVFTYGAVGNGTVDDWEAIQATIAAAEAASDAGYGGVVRLPPFVYKVTRPLVVVKDHVRIEGSLRGGTRITYTPDLAYGSTLLKFEGTGVIQYAGLKYITLKTTDTTNTKICVDVHDAREFLMRDVVIQNWTGGSSIALRVRGRDAGLFEKLHIRGRKPIAISKNDDGAGGYRDVKDIDHHVFRDLNLECTDTTGDKAAVTVEDGVVMRQVSFEGYQAWVQGGFRLIDTTLPRAYSQNLRFAGIRNEGMGEDLSATGFFAIYIDRNPLAPISSVSVRDSLLAAENSGVSGVYTRGVSRLALDCVDYAGLADPVDSTALRSTVSCALGRQDGPGKYVIESEGQWDELSITRPRSWWRNNAASGNLTDRQDAAVSGLADRPLAVVGAPLYEQTKSGWQDNWTAFDELVNQRFQINTTDAELDPNSHSIALFEILWFDAGWVPGGTRQICNMGSAVESGAGTGPILRVRADAKLEIVIAGVTGTASVNTYIDDQPFAYWFAYNRTAGTIKCWLRKADRTGEIITGTYDASVGNTAQKGFGSGDGTICYKGRSRYRACWVDAGAEQDGGVVLTALGWPT